MFYSNHLQISFHIDKFDVDFFSSSFLCGVLYIQWQNLNLKCSYLKSEILFLKFFRFYHVVLQLKRVLKASIRLKILTETHLIVLHL